MACRFNGSTSLGKHLIALKLFSLNGHLGITILGGSFVVGDFKLRHRRLKTFTMVLFTLAIIITRALLCSSSLLLLILQTLTLIIDLIKQ